MKDLRVFCILLSSLAISLGSISQNKSNNFYIQGKIRGIDTGKIILYYEKTDTTIAISNDTAIVSKGIFNFQGIISIAQQMHIRVISKNQDRYSQSFLVDIGCQNFWAGIDSDTFAYKHPYVSGSPLHEEFNKTYSAFREKVVARYDSLNTQLSNFYKKHKGQIPKKILTNINAKRTSIYTQFDSVLVEYIKSKPML